MNAAAAALLAQFAAPATVVDAVVAYARASASDPEEVLEEAFRLTLQFRSQGILVRASEELTTVDPAESSFAPDDVVFGLRIVRAAHTLADTEIYEARFGSRAVALKYVLSAAPPYVRTALRHEEAVLRWLSERGPGLAPGVLGADHERADPYLVLDWIDGETLATRLERATSWQARVSLATAAVDAYEELHRTGLLHGDVHANNVLVRSDGRAALIDLGGAGGALPPPGHRIGLVEQYEPEAAAAALAGAEVPLPSGPGEQYALAALIYRVLTGRAPFELSLETAAALRQITDREPEPFASAGVDARTVERVLRRGLAKDPGDRFESLGAFERALATALRRQRPMGARHKRPRSSGHRRMLEEFRARFGLQAALTRDGLRNGPTASVYYGAAGLAYANLRVAVTIGDPELLAAAEIWLERGRREVELPRGLDGRAIGLDPRGLAPESLLHGRAGVEYVGALRAAVTGNSAEATAAIGRFTAEVERLAVERDASLSLDADLANGLAGLLVAISQVVPTANESTSGALRAAGEVAAARVARALDRRLRDGLYLGLAHGHAGAAFALLRWAERSRTEIARPALVALDDLAGRARRSSGRANWPLLRRESEGPSWRGWCHGSAGYILLWTEAQRVTGDQQYGRLAIEAAADVVASQQPAGSSLCCGTAGAAIALSGLARLTDDPSWLTAGRRLIEAAPESDGGMPSWSLFKGNLGLTLAALESRSDGAPFPIFGLE